MDKTALVWVPRVASGGGVSVYNRAGVKSVPFNELTFQVQAAAAAADTRHLTTSGKQA